MMKRSLRQELVSRGLPEKRYAFKVVPAFADLLWDVAGREEYERLEPALIIDAKATERRLVVERIRNELRYYICTYRDPHTVHLGEYEIGVVASVAHLYELVVEFLDREVRPSELQTPRVSQGKPIGRQSP